MRRLLLVLLFLSNGAWAAVSAQETNQVYDQILKSNHIKGAPILIIVQDSEVNAACMGSVIQVNTGMLRFAYTKSEIAVVLGHELGHFINHDHGSRPDREYKADKIGVILAHKSGYDVCSGVSIIKRFNDPASATHPASIDRYNAVKCS